MKKNFGFVSLESGVYSDVTDAVLASEYYKVNYLAALA
jgi:hypothetical protein